MANKMPSIQWYVGDWRKDPGVQALDYESRGVWFEMLMIMFESESRGKLMLNGQAMPDPAIAVLLGLDLAKFQQIASKLLAYGVATRCPNTGAIMNRRMVRDEDLRAKRSFSGMLGGMQKASNSEASAQQKLTPSSSSSSSSSQPDKNNIWPESISWIPKFLDEQKILLIPHGQIDAAYSLYDPAMWSNLEITCRSQWSQEFLRRCFARAANWLLLNPKRGKTPNGYKRFLKTWIEGDAEKEARSAHNSGNDSHSKHRQLPAREEFADDIQRMNEQRERMKK